MFGGILRSAGLATTALARTAGREQLTALPYLHSCIRNAVNSGIVGTPELEDVQSRAEEEARQGLPEVLPDVDEGRSQVSEEELRQRKTKAVLGWLEHQVGKERVELVRILQGHHVIVRGGPDEGQRLLDALLEWKQGGPVS